MNPAIAYQIAYRFYPSTVTRAHEFIGRYFILQDISLNSVSADNKPMGKVAASAGKRMIQFIKDNNKKVNVILSMHLEDELQRKGSLQ
jgi:hypothetical protein